MCAPSDTISRRVGNCYTAAVYMNLLSLVCNKHEDMERRAGGDILMFSYGSGAVASAFVLRARAPARGAFTLGRIARTADVARRLASRQQCDATAFNAAMDLRATRYGHCGYEPSGSTETLARGAFYLTKVDELHRRTYARKV